jgi:hypothetical protein
MVLAMVDESVPLGGAIHLIATVDANVASSIDDALVRIVPRLLTDLIALAAAEILVLRRQIALYRERRIKPRRIDAVTRTSLALLSRFFQLAGCSGRGTSRDVIRRPRQVDPGWAASRIPPRARSSVTQFF